MSRETERVLLMAHFEQTWDSADGPVAYPNHEFKTPKDSLFAVVSIVDRGSSRESLGQTYYKKHRGTLQVDIYTPLNRGIRPARVIADRLESVYDSLELVTSDSQRVSFYTPTAREIGGNEARAANLEDNWSRYVVEFPFIRHEVFVK